MRFHVEHPTDLFELFSNSGITESEMISLLIEYGKSIHSENTKYNLTGHKTLFDIITNLIIGSIKPLTDINVPRGTLFADLGSGSGIPGIPVAIKFRESRGVLFDSNNKKIKFINDTAHSLGIPNIIGVSSRIEDVCRSSEYRGSFDIVFTRAMSDIYTVAELGAPLLKKGGFIFMYINRSQMNVNDSVIEHISDVGLSPKPLVDFREKSDLQNDAGLILFKEKETDDKYPRRMAVINRMAKR